jgi:arginine N-succinyltransferase
VAVRIEADAQKRKGPNQLAVCNCETDAFRATFSDDCRFDADDNVLLISPAAADALKVTDADFVRYLNLDKGAK